MNDLPPAIRFAEFELDEGNASLTRNGQAVALPPKAFAVLCRLASAPRQLVRKDALLDAVWGHRHVSESVLKSVVSQVRAALGDESANPRFIETVSRFGYRFVAPLITAAGAAAPPPRAAPLPAMANGGTLVGRGAALQRLREALAAAREGERKAIWIAGEAGVGKTSLIKHFLAESGVAVALGHCVEHYGSGEPFLPLLEALREYAVRDASVPALLRSVAPTWAVQLPWLIDEADRANLHRELAGAHPDRMVRELAELMSRMASEQPLILVTEDLHWSDQATLRALGHFVRQPRRMPVLWISSCRLAQVIAEDHPFAELRHELRLHPHCEEILLDSFSESEVGEYLKAHTPGGVVAEQLVQRVHRHTEGLPLFVANVVDTLASEREAQASATPAQPALLLETLRVPDSLGGVVERQLRRLPADVQALLGAASVCGAEFRCELLAQLLERSPEAVQASCDELVGRRYWLRDVDVLELPDGQFDARYEFAHALYERVIYQSLSTPQRARYHRNYARILIESGGKGGEAPAAEIASHFERGLDAASAVRWYAEAAQVALGRYTPKAASELAARGLALLEKLPAGAARLEAEFALVRPAGGAASVLHGVASEQAKQLFARVQALYGQLPPTPANAVALNGMGWVYYVCGDFAEAQKLALQLKQVAEAHDDPVLRVFGCNLRGVALVNQGALREACDELLRGLEMCVPFGDAMPSTAFIIDTEVSMCMNVSVPLADLGLHDQAQARYVQGVARAKRIKQPFALMLSHWCGGMLGVRQDDVQGVADHAVALANIVEQALVSQGEGPSLWLQGWVLAQRGRGREGHDLIMRGFECHARHGMYAGCAEVLGYAAQALLLADEHDAARARLEEAIALATKIGEGLSRSQLELIGAQIALATDGPAAARARARAALQLARANGALTMELRALMMIAELKGAKAEDRRAVRKLLESITEGSDLPLLVRARAIATANA